MLWFFPINVITTVKGWGGGGVGGGLWGIL